MTTQRSTVGAAGGSKPPSSSPSAAIVKIENFAFQPRNLQIKAGTTVTWVNDDDVPHTASSTTTPQAFDSGALDTDDRYSFTFTQPGSFAYFCKVHPHMTGTVVVQ
jgi:plastocyanin